VAYEGDTLKVERQTETGIEVVEAKLPVVISVTAGVNEPRYPSLKGIMGAKQKPLDRPTVADLGLDGLGGASAGQKITDVTAAPERAAGEIVTDDGEAAKRIVDFLAERKVI
jgi:electron transfer flavoprotein beta subunit